jgi:hypothetical protein
MRGLLFASAIAFCGCITNVSQADSGVLYAGIGVGKGTADLPDKIWHLQTIEEATSANVTALIIGDRILPFFAVEFGYVNLGEYTFETSAHSVKLDSSSFDLSMLLRHEIRPALAPFLRVGGFSSTTDYRIIYNGSKTTATSEDFGLMFGVGLDIEPMDRIFARVDWMLHRGLGGQNTNLARIDNSNISQIMISGFIEF